jgi:hypothetical protein
VLCRWSSYCYALLLALDAVVVESSSLLYCGAVCGRHFVAPLAHVLDCRSRLPFVILRAYFFFPPSPLCVLPIVE